jgi:hypothetical protein
MLRTIIIGPDAKQAQQLEKAVGALANEVSVSRFCPIIRTKAYCPHASFLRPRRDLHQL